MPARATGITVREAMKLEPLSKAVVLGGEAGLDRIVTTINVMETDDAPRLLTGNELLISAFFAVRDDLNAQLRWLDELARRGCAGVILCYVGRYFKGDIDALSKRADELALPLLTIPGEKVLYSDIMAAVFNAILHRQTRQLHYALSVHNRLTQEALMGASLETLIQSLSSLLQGTVIMTDAELNVMVVAPHGPEGQRLLERILVGPSWHPAVHPHPHNLTSSDLYTRIKALLAEECTPDKPVFHISLQPIQVEYTQAGYLFVFRSGKDISEMQDYALQVGVTVIALERMRALTVRETERRLQGDFLDDILHWSIKSPELIKSRASALGLELEDKRAVMIVSIDDRRLSESGDHSSSEAEGHRETIYRLVDRIVRRESPSSVVVPRGSRLLVLISGENDVLSSNSIKEQALNLGEIILKEFKIYQAEHSETAKGSGPSAKHGGGLEQIELSIGIGSTSRTFSTLHQSYMDAAQCIEVSQRLLGPGHVIHHDDISLYSVLDFVAERREARQMVEDVLGPIKAYDTINNTDLMKTLEMLCLSGECSNEIAKKLYIHRNTLAYRQTRIKELLGFDPFTGQGRVRMNVVLMLDKLIEASQH